jgi:hypothetical protein
MIHLTILRAANSYASEYFDTEDLCATLKAELGEWTPACRLYEGEPVRCEVTPKTPEDVAALEAVTAGEYTCIVGPRDFIVSLAETVLHVVSFGLLNFHKENTKPVQEISPNNSLSDRRNSARPNERIPYIVGTVRSTPDLIALPYRIFVDDLELEFAAMCIGVGNYTILDCKDGVTPVAYIDGEFVAVYGPNSSPNQFAAIPVATFGTNPTSSIPQIKNVQQSNSVNGQVLRAPNSGNLNTDNNVGFAYPDLMYTGANGGDPAVDFTEYFIASTELVPQYLTIAANGDGINASDPNGNVHSVSLAGTYMILDVTQTNVTLSNPSSVNSNWNTLQQFAGQQSSLDHSFSITGDGDVWDGPYILQIANMSEVWANITAPNGLYRIDSSGNQHAMTVTAQMGVQAIDSNNNPIGNEILGSVTLSGSALDQKSVGATLQMVLPSSGFAQARIQRITPMGTDNNSQYFEQIQWRDLFGVSPIGVTNFGNVTTLVSITSPTQDALSVKDRKLNLLVTRNLPTWSNRNGFAYSAGIAPLFSSTLYPTNNAADILCAMALDSTIGRRTIYEIDVPTIYRVLDAAHLGAGRLDGQVSAYFGTFLATEFCYTFDDSKESFEESVTDIMQATNCNAYRSGSFISVFFEQKTTNSAMLFTHRNKVPDTEKQTFTFGTLNENDGIEYDYIEPDAANYPNVDTTQTLYFPPDESYVNPKKITSKGVRNGTQAQLNGYRLYQKLVNSNGQVEFEATQEAAMLIQNERILNADNTRSDTFDGQIVAVASDNQTLTLSQPFTPLTGVTYALYVQLPDGSLQNLPFSFGSSPTTLVLTAPPIPLPATDPSLWAQSTYTLIGNNAVRTGAFLVAKKDVADTGKRTYNLTCTNYSDSFYLYDTGVKTGLIVPPPYGYGPQGYTGAGVMQANGQNYTGNTSNGFNSSSYSTSSLNTSNNASTQQTTSSGGTYNVASSNSTFTVNGE